MYTLVHSFIITKFTLDTDVTVLYNTLNKVTLKEMDKETNCRQKLKQGGTCVYFGMLSDGLRY